MASADGDEARHLGAGVVTDEACRIGRGFAAVLNKGDPTAGAVLVILNEKGRKARVLERALQPGGTYSWQDIVKPKHYE